MKISLSNYYNVNTSMGKKNFCVEKENPKTKVHQNKYDLFVLSSNPSFGIKKNEFEGCDLAFINKYKAPIEQFKTRDELKIWAKKELDKKSDLSKYKNNDITVQEAVRNSLSEWKNYLLEDDFYKNNPVISLIIFDAITSELYLTTHDLPPLLHKGVLSDTVGQYEEKTKADPKSTFDFNKMYQNNLRLEFTKDEIEEDEDSDAPKVGRWIRIPSEEHDSENFEKNVEKLKALSHRSWCTRSTRAEMYLKKGDFCVYLENNKPKVGIRFEQNEIVEIQGERNNGRVPLNYIEEIKYYMKKNKFKGQGYEIKKAETAKKEVDAIRKKFADDFREKRYENILNYLGFKTEILDDGMLEISHYDQPYNFFFEELGINENDLFKKVRKIKGTSNFKHCKATSLFNIESIGERAYFGESQITSLGNLKAVGGRASFSHSKIKNLGGLESIGQASFMDSQVEDLGNLKRINEDVYFGESKIKSLNKLEYIGGVAKIFNCELVDLGALKYIGKGISISKDKINSITGNVEYIGGEVNCHSFGIITDFSTLPFFKAKIQN